MDEAQPDDQIESATDLAARRSAEESVRTSVLFVYEAGRLASITESPQHVKVYRYDRPGTFIDSAPADD
jgi:hypothetical protein